MLCSMKEMLADARNRKYAIPAFDVSNYEMMKAVLEVCEEERSPALLMGLEVDLGGKGLNLIPAMVKSAAEFFNVPVCFHLDHAGDLAFIKKAVEAGFSSVMYDGSKLPFSQNLERTKEVVAFVHANGLTVEAELGHVGDAMVGNENATTSGDDDPEDTLTDVDEARRFVEESNVDALAVAIGTSHGVYKKTPSLRIDRLQKISNVCKVPFVLHGGSGTPIDQLQEAIANGICKINIYSDVVSAMNKGLKNKLNTMGNPATWPAFTFEESRVGMKEAIREKIRAFGSNGRV